MCEYPYNFNAKIVKYDFGRMYFSVVYVPKEILSQLDFGKSKRLRVDGEINGARFEGALMPSRGKWYLMVSKKLQKRCGVTLGKIVSVSFEIANQDAIAVPSELQFALEANDQAREVWNRWTVGKRRSFCYRVDSAKMPETRERRVDEVLERLNEEGERMRRNG